MKTIELQHDPNDSWAEVELWRWQYGELPASTDMRPLDVAAALRGMAAAIEKGCKEKKPDEMPSPFNVCSVLRYVASRWHAHD
jgi:hypothetical protein